MAIDIAAELLALDGILDAERHAIRNGAFMGLEVLAIEKSRLLDLISQPQARPSATFLRELRAKADGNQRLLGAALKGVRSAQRRLDMIRRASSSMTTYDSLGRAQTIGLGDGTVERRS